MAKKKKPTQLDKLLATPFSELLPPLSSEEHEALKASIEENGVQVPILVDEDDNILDGHHRYTATKKQNRKDIPRRVIEGLTQFEKISLVFQSNLNRRNLSTDQKRELRQNVMALALALKQENPKKNTQAHIAAMLGVARQTVSFWLNIPNAKNGNGNKKPVKKEEIDARTTLSKNDKKKIIERIEGGETQAQVAADYKVGQPAVSKLVRKNASPPKVKESKPDLSAQWETSLGQVWQLGGHRLVCGDVYNPEHVYLLLGNGVPDALITDPPYGIDYKPAWKKWDGTETDFGKVIGDDHEFDPTPFLNYPTVVLFGANYFTPHLPIGNWICWDKHEKKDLDNMIGSPFELAWFTSKHTARKAVMIRVHHAGAVNADSQKGNNETRFVSTQKPIRVMQEILKATTVEGESVYDPFVGSGSTLLACESMKRKCLAMEIDPKRVAIVLGRWAGQKGNVSPCLA